MGNLFSFCTKKDDFIKNSNNNLKKNKICTICNKSHKNCIMYDKKFTNKYIKQSVK